MMGSLTLLLLGNPNVVPVLVASEIVAAAGVIVFACNIFQNVKPRARPIFTQRPRPRATPQPAARQWGTVALSPTVDRHPAKAGNAESSELCSLRRCRLRSCSGVPGTSRRSDIRRFGEARILTPESCRCRTLAASMPSPLIPMRIGTAEIRAGAV